MGARADESAGRATMALALTMMTMVMVEATGRATGEGVPPRCRQEQVQLQQPNDGSWRKRSSARSACRTSTHLGERWMVDGSSTKQSVQLSQSLVARSLCMLQPPPSRRRDRTVLPESSEVSTQTLVQQQYQWVA